MNVNKADKLLNMHLSAILVLKLSSINNFHLNLDDFLSNSITFPTSYEKGFYL